MRIQKTADLVLAALGRIGSRQATWGRFAQPGYTIVADSDKKIDRSGTFAPADAKRIALFQAYMLIVNIQRYLPQGWLCRDFPMASGGY